MRKFISSYLFFAVAQVSVAYASSHDMSLRDNPIYLADKGYQLVLLSDLQKEIIEDFSVGKLPHLVLECTQGMSLPFDLSLKSDFFFLEGDSSRTIKVLKTCFIRCTNETFLFSTDLQNWKDFQEFFTGMIGISINKEEKTSTVSLDILLNQRN